MAEDREDGSPGHKAEQFDKLDEVGEMEGWGGELQDNDDEQDVRNNSSAADKENKEQSETSLNKESSPNKDVKFTASSSTKDVMSESAASKDVKLSTDSALKRKADNPGAQEQEAKEMKLSSEKEDKRRQSVEEIEVISTVSWNEHQKNKMCFVDAMIKLSEELKLASDYRDWVQKEREDGMMFPLFDIDQPPEPILLSSCQLISGYKNDSPKLCLGLARDDEVLRFSAREAKYVPGVRSAVKAFEEMVRSCSKPLFDPITQQGYWYSVTVVANSKGETLLQVDLYADNQQEGEVRFAEAKDILVKYFSSEKAALDCHVSSIYLRLVFAKKNHGREKVPSERSCIMGNKFIVETISGITVNLYPWSFLSKGSLAMTSLCEAMLKVLSQERCKTVLELGCGTGIVGQSLAKHCENVLGVDTAECIAEAKVNADENHLSNCTYFDKNMKDIWTTLDNVLQDKPPVMVIVNALNHYLVDGPVIAWLTRSNKVCRVVYVKMTKTKTPKSRITILCTPTREPKKHHDDPMPYFPLYALPVNLGAKCAAVLVLQHVESNFIEELYKTREKYTVKCIRIVTSTPGVYKAEDDPREKTKRHSTSPAAKKIVSISKPNDKNANGKISDVTPAAKKNLSISKSNDKNANGNITNAKIVTRNKSLSGGRGPARRGVDTGGTRISRWEELGGPKNGQQPRRDGSNPTDVNHYAGFRNVRVNKDGKFMTRFEALSNDGTLPPRGFRNVLQNQPWHNRIPGLFDKLISPTEIQDLGTVSQGLRMYAERHMDIADDFREERFVDKIIHDRNRNLLNSSFVHGVVPPRTEDRRQFLQEKVMVENIAGDRDERSEEFYGRDQVRFYENDDLQSFIEENRVTHKDEGKDSFRESSRLPRDAETLGGARMRESFRDELSSGHDLYAPDVWGKLFRLVKDSELFEHGLGSKINVGEDERRKVMFADIQDMRSIDADLQGSVPGRSFDDAELGRRKPRTDDIASGIQTDVRGINIRAGGWKARDDTHNMEGIHDSFSKFDAYLSNVKSLIEDFQESWKGKPEFKQSLPNAGTKNEWRALSPNSKFQVTGDIQRETPYRDDKPNYFGKGGKISNAELFAFDERRAEDGIAERSRVTFGPEDNRIMFGGTDRNRTHIDGSERNRVVGESVNERRIFDRLERTGASIDGPNDRNRNMFFRAEDGKWQVFETEDRNKPVFSKPNRNSRMFGGSEDRERPVYDDVEDRNRSVYSKLEDRKRRMYDEPDDRKRQMYVEPDDRRRQMYDEPDHRKLQMFDEPDDRRRQMFGEPADRKEQSGDIKSLLYSKLEDIKKLMYSEPEDRKRSLHGEPVDTKRLKYGELEDNRPVYKEPGDRKRSVYGGPEDRSGYMFSKTDDRNLPVTERSRSVEEVGRNRPIVEEKERNRLMAGEREREKVLFGGRTDIYRTGYYAADSKVDSKVEDGDKEASKRHHHHHQQQQHSPLPPPPSPPPPLLTDEQMVEVQSTKEKAQNIALLKAQEAQQGVSIPAKQAGGSSVAKGKDGKTFVEESSVKKNDAKNSYVGDRSLEKGPQTYWAVDRGREPAESHQTPSSSNREWDKVQSSGGHSSAASWASSWGQEGRQRDTQEQHGTFRSLQQSIDAKQLPPLPSQHVGKYGTSDEPGRGTLSSSSSFGQSPQNYGHSYQQYGLLGSVPAQPSTVSTGNMSQYGNWQGGGSVGWNTSSGWSATGGWGMSGTGNTSNNWSSQSGNAGYTWK